MAWTYTTLKSAIQDYLETTETTFVSNLPVIIRQAEDRILKSVQLPDFKKNVTGSLTDGNPYLESPSDFLAPYSLAVDNSGYEFLMFKDVAFIREAYPVLTTESIPKYYAIFDESTFILGPTPNAESTLLYGSLVEAYTFLKGDADMLNLYLSRYEDSLAKLKVLGEGYSTTDSYRSGSVRQARR